ncbi:hypothetical protein [Streptomyces sp. CC224B]|uniref:hypothetical protein n=1 Tax=Streptomyces sp. CC224B TaxID=3044571 RepID=UPI0024A85517|nr:hypothetical protein [Streptomyces sp. CC224B]
MTASPPLMNGQRRPAMPVLGDWRPATDTPVPEPVEEQRDPEPAVETPDESAAAKAWAEAEERRLAAEAQKEAALRRAAAEAEAIRAKAAEETRRMRLANDRAERKAREEQAASEARIAESLKRKADADRAREEADRQAAEQRQSATEQAEAVEKAGKRWRRVAKGFYVLCAAVALPVQMNAFYRPGAEYLVVAPFFIELIALVALVGAAAAVTAGRPHWHYRLVAWAGALTAATINIVHGLAAYDPATAFGTALASVAGPGMWDLHEHGRLRKRDGKVSWRQRRRQRKAAAREEARRAAEKKAADKAAAAAAEQLAAARAAEFPKVWEHACRLAAALGETAVTEAVWRRAHLDIEGTDPGESAEVIRARNVAAARVESARTGTPVNARSRAKSPQVDQQVPPRSRRGHAGGPKVRGVRRPNDTPKFSQAARRQASITARNALGKDQ